MTTEYEDIPEVEDFLAHFGVKGMKWGVRRDKSRGSESSREKRSPEEKAALRAKAKKVAIGTGVLVAAAGAAYVANSMSKKGSLPISSLNRKPPKAAEVKKLVDKAVESPTSLVFSTRTKNKGFSIYDKGGLSNPFGALESAGMITGRNELQPGNIRKLKDGSVAAVMHDPRGRKDSAGRVIPHSMIIPKSMSAGIDSISDVASKIWPLLEDRYAAMYDPKD